MANSSKQKDNAPQTLSALHAVKIDQTIFEVVFPTVHMNQDSEVWWLTVLGMDPEENMYADAFFL